MFLTTVVYSGGLLGFLVSSALGVLAHLLFLFANDCIRTVALDARALLLLLFVVIGLPRWLWDSLAYTASCSSTSITACGSSAFASGGVTASTSCRVSFVTSIVTSFGMVRMNRKVVDLSLCHSSSTLTISNLLQWLSLGLDHSSWLTATKVTRSPVSETMSVFNSLLGSSLAPTLLSFLIDSLHLFLGCDGLGVTHLLVVFLVGLG